MTPHSADPLTLRGVHKRYGNGRRKEVHAVRGVTVSIEAGEFVVILGPSGCGKSTLLRLVAGLETLSDGDIDLGPTRLNDLEPAQRNIAMVFQNYALYPHMSTFDNMAYSLRISGLSRTEIDTRVRKAAAALELSDLLERKPGQLSGGQRQRVAMGRAIVREPRLFLFDEPLSNLDAKLRVQARLEIRRLHAQLGRTALFVTHDQVEAMTLADRIIVMNNGFVEQIGTPTEIYAKPATTFVAGFIGAPPMNLLDARVEGQSLLLAGVAVKLDFSLPIQGPVTVGLRAESIQVGEGPLSFESDLIEHLGATQLIHGHLGESPLVISVSSGHHTTRTGERLQLSVRTADLHFFDPASGRRIQTSPV
jgi:sn-glycerol 3-phosphate transport system ATP-binding protein